jgi:transposase
MKNTKEVVLDGVGNPIELQSFPLKGKPVYLKLYRRRWKYKGENKHYSNTYDFNPQGVKAIKEFASFFKQLLDKLLTNTTPILKPENIGTDMAIDEK